MIAKTYRFHGHGSIRFVYQTGQTARVKFLQLKYVANPRRQESRLAVVVAKKVTKKAPTRNRIRRRLYEALRLNWPMLRGGYDMVLTVFDERVADLPAPELRQVARQLLEAAHLFKE